MAKYDGHSQSAARKEGSGCACRVSWCGGGREWKRLGGIDGTTPSLSIFLLLNITTKKLKTKQDFVFVAAICR
jgi:hypothetical protein